MALSGEFYAPFKGRFVPSDDMAEIGSAESPVHVITATTFVGDLQGSVLGQSAASFNSTGYCRLQVDSTTQLSLQRYQGVTIPLKVSGTWTATEIPSAGVLLANTGLTAATLYRIYAYSNAGTVTLEADATDHAADADTGIRIKTGDATRTLVGMVYMGAGTPGTFIDSVTQRFCLNWFNRRSLDMTNTYSADRTTASATLVEVNTEIRMEFLAWPDEAVEIGIAGTMKVVNGSQAGTAAVGIDSTTVGTQSVSYTGASGGNSRGSSVVWVSKVLAVGYHYATLLGASSTGNITWEAADAPVTGTSKARVWALIRG